jgi:hypothetical protein
MAKNSNMSQNSKVSNKSKVPKRVDMAERALEANKLGDECIYNAEDFTNRKAYEAWRSAAVRTDNAR